MLEERGKYIVLEGADGTGKTTQVSRLERRIAGIKGAPYVSVFHEPEGRIRQLLIDPDFERLPKTDVLLQNAGRSLTLPKIGAAIERGVWALADRNWLSTLTYQGYGDRVDLKVVEIINQATIGGHPKPDLVLVLDAPPEVVAKRLQDRKKDYYERKGRNFHARVREGYLEQARRRGYPVIDASGSEDQVLELIWNHVYPLLKE